MPIAAAKIINKIVFSRTFAKKINFLLIFLLFIGKHLPPLHYLWQTIIKCHGAQFGNKNPLTIGISTESQRVYLLRCQSRIDVYPIYT